MYYVLVLEETPHKLCALTLNNSTVVGSSLQNQADPPDSFLWQLAHAPKDGESLPL